MQFISRKAGQPLRGDLQVPGDKSISHRALIFSTLANGTGNIRGFLSAGDTLATLRACQQLGAIITDDGKCVTVQGVGLNGLRPPAAPVDLGNSGTALRLLAGALSAQDFDSILCGDASLQSRPMDRIIRPLQMMGANVVAAGDGCAPLQIERSDGLVGIDYTSPVASAQVKSCILLAGLCAGVSVSVTEPQKSRDHTERLLPAMGAATIVDGLKVSLAGRQQLSSIDITVPGDPSSAAFAAVAACLVPGSDIVLNGVGMNPGRDGIFRVLARMGAQIEISNVRQASGEPVADVHVVSSALNGIDLPEDWIPTCIDEIPVIMIAAAAARGVTRIRGATELRVKESDRLSVMATGLQQLGVALEEHPDGVDISGGVIYGGEVDAMKDHRCAMSFLMSGQVARAPVAVEGCELIATSYPGFIAQMRSIGLSLDD